MEIQSSSFFLIFFFLLLLLLFLVRNYRQNRNNLPPGPWKLPLIGNLHQLAWLGSLPHYALRELAQSFGPLMHLQLGEISVLIVTSSEMAMEIMKTQDLTFASRPEILSAKILVYGCINIGFSPYGDYWRQMRKICTLELLSAKRVQSFSYIRKDEVEKLIQSIRSSLSSSPPTPINFGTRIAELVGTFVSRAAFGNVSEEHQEFLRLIKEVVELSDGFDVADLFPSVRPIHLVSGLKAKLEKMHKKLDSILDNIVAQNLKNLKAKNDDAVIRDQENLVEVLLRVQQDPDLDIPITINSVKAVIWEIFAAGTDTSSTTLEWAMSEMMKNPRVRKKAQAEIRRAFRGKDTIHESDTSELNYLKLVIKETLRLHPPLPLLLPRESREACKINGYEIPAKTKVIVNAWALGRDPKHWHDADSFIPERFHDTSFNFKGTNFDYIPFGGGRRTCPGITFGIANMEFALAKLLYHFDWELPNQMKPEELDMDEAFGAVAARKNHLYLIPIPYKGD
ncbi:cytochrome P450 71D8-like [Prosopis cineraria]|uniref:cytochrome P450 71D8-like n=1 Tax=Prosopis cineraria TaxID=364024 RepID=UPI00240F0D1D|nr:cytochrome P450 71D8-like [Prosopis cineraria]